MSQNKYQIFVSSTYSDLAQIRRNVMDAIQKTNNFPVGMEQFSADDDEQWEIIQETIRQTDYYICIIGHRYGSLGKHGVSYTEKEWDYAKEIGVPIMSFVRDRDVATKPSERESDPSMTLKLQTFIEKVKSDKMVDFWNESKELDSKVITALYKAFSRKPRPGWIRANSESVAQELAALSNENRDLRSEIQRLSNYLSSSTPNFTINLNTKSIIEGDFNPDHLIDFTTYPNKIDINSINSSLLKYTTDRDIEDYNNQIEKLIPQFNLIHSIERMEKNSLYVELNIKNNGSSKGSGIIIDLEFPEWIEVFSQNDLSEFDKPYIPLPQNPIIEAEHKLRQKQIGNSLRYSLTFPGNSLPATQSNHLNLIGHLVTKRDEKWSCRAKNQKATVEIESLLHTRQDDLACLVVVPKKSGEGEIKISIICEELSTPQNYSIPIKFNKL